MNGTTRSLKVEPTDPELQERWRKDGDIIVMQKDNTMKSSI